MNNERNTDANRRAVLRVTLDVDERGQIIGEQLEPAPDAPHMGVVHAAWQAARRWHPWILTRDQAEAREFLEEGHGRLLRHAGELLLSIDDEPTPKRHDAMYVAGYRAALEELRASDPVAKLRNVVEALRTLTKPAEARRRAS